MIPEEDGMEIVIVEREFEEPLSRHDAEQMQRDGAACYRLRRVKHLHTYLSKDGRRAICAYLAPDAASLREASDEQGIPYSRVWTATSLPALPDAPE